jgi:hypothetical protein
MSCRVWCGCARMIWDRGWGVCRVRTIPVARAAAAVWGNILDHHHQRAWDQTLYFLFLPGELLKSAVF